MSREELNKTFMMISNLKKLFGLLGFHKKISAVRGKLKTVLLNAVQITNV